MEREITYIRPDMNAAGLGILLKTGTKYFHIGYVRRDVDSGKVVRLGWTDQVPRDQVTLLDGFHPDIVEQYERYRQARQAWRNERDEAYRAAHYDEQSLAHAHTQQRMMAWEGKHPQPKRKDFIKELEQ